MADERPVEKPKPKVEVVTPKVTTALSQTEIEQAAGRERLRHHARVAELRRAAEEAEAAAKEAEKAE